ALDERQAQGLFLRSGGTIAGGAPEHAVDDVDPLGEAGGGEDAVQQLAGLADEGLAAGVLVGAGGLADDQQLGRRIPASDHGLAGGEPLQRTAVEGVGGGLQRRQVRGGGGQPAGLGQGVGDVDDRDHRGGGARG